MTDYTARSRAEREASRKRRVRFSQPVPKDPKPRWRGWAVVFREDLLAAGSDDWVSDRLAVLGYDPGIHEIVREDDVWQSRTVYRWRRRQRLRLTRRTTP